LCDPDEKKVEVEKLDSVEEETDGDQEKKTKHEDPVAFNRDEDPDAIRKNKLEMERNRI